MKKQYIHFVPKADGGVSVWSSNIKEKIAAIGAQLGVSPIGIASVETACDRLISNVNLVAVKRTDLAEAVKQKNDNRLADLQIISKVILQIKAHSDYQDSIGSALGINGYNKLFDLKEIKPVIKAKAYEGRVDVSFNLQVMKSITIYSRIKGSYGWERLGNDYESPFEDRRPLAVPHQAEVREYMAMYFNGKEEIGQPSDMVSAVFGG